MALTGALSLDLSVLHHESLEVPLFIAHPETLLELSYEVIPVVRVVLVFVLSGAESESSSDVVGPCFGNPILE